MHSKRVPLTSYINIYKQSTFVPLIFKEKILFSEISTEIYRLTLESGICGLQHLVKD